MSALEFSKVSTEQRCESKGCIRAGRWTLLICGYPIPSENPYALAQSRAVVCGPCRKKWSEWWSEAASRQQQVEEAIEGLSGSVVERTDAIDRLNELGFAPHMIAREVKRVAEQREAVAA